MSPIQPVAYTCFLVNRHVFNLKSSVSKLNFVSNLKISNLKNSDTKMFVYDSTMQIQIHFVHLTGMVSQETVETT